MTMAGLYDTDYYAWALQTADALRTGRIEEVDAEHLIEELEEMSSSTRRALISRLTVLLAHLVKWQFQPGKRSRSWQATIRVQRRSLDRLLAENPTLRGRLDDFVASAYADAVDLAWAETGLDVGHFPPACPYSAAEILDDAFYPEAQI